MASHSNMKSRPTQAMVIRLLPFEVRAVFLHIHGLLLSRADVVWRLQVGLTNGGRTMQKSVEMMSKQNPDS